MQAPFSWQFRKQAGPSWEANGRGPNLPLRLPHLEMPELCCFCGCCFSRAMLAKLLQSSLTLCDPMYCSLPGSSVHGILQARKLEWVATPSSRGSSPPRDRTCVSCTGRQVLYHQHHLGVCCSCGGGVLHDTIKAPESSLESQRMFTNAHPCTSPPPARRRTF